MNKQLTHIILRDELMKATRAFFAERTFTEVTPPMLNDAIPNEPNLYPFVTTWKRNETVDHYYLPTSPERSLKIALGKGLGNCYAIGHCFRNLESSGSLHSPEFLMLEWYRVNAEYHDIMHDIEEYISMIQATLTTHQGTTSLSLRGIVDACPPLAESNLAHYRTISIKKLLEDRLDIRYEDLVTKDKVMIEFATRLGYTTRGATWRQLFDQIMVNEIEARLPKEPLFLIDFPSRISPLCKKKVDEPHIAERFELYIDGVEIANGNNENTNVTEIQKMFEEETGKDRSPLDVQFLSALQVMHDSGSKFAGVGLGLDRLLMVMMGEGEITTF